MNVLIIKTSSMGDVIHTLPALTDAGNAIQGIRFDWVVEKSFAEIPKWHPLVDRVFPIELRKWRKSWWKAWRSGEVKSIFREIKKKRYDFVIDAQGLVKSGLISFFTRGLRCGLDWNSARESLASIFYQRRFKVNFKQHAVVRARELFSKVLDYTLSESSPDYGIDRAQLIDSSQGLDAPFVLFFHGTTWETKHWPEAYWCGLAKKVSDAGINVYLPWGSELEKERADRIATHGERVSVLPKMNLFAVAKVLAAAQGVVAVDTGLCHMAAALNVPTISLYGPTNATLTGAMGKSQMHLSSTFECAPCMRKICKFKESATIHPPCFAEFNPERVFQSMVEKSMVK